MSKHRLADAAMVEQADTDEEFSRRERGSSKLQLGALPHPQSTRVIAVANQKGGVGTPDSLPAQSPNNGYRRCYRGCHPS